MTDKPNCENCPIKNDCSEWKYSLVRAAFRSYGLLCHPGAKEWLMADVIKELEKQQEELERKARTLMFQPMGDKYASKAEGIKKAISLIRNGVNCETFKNKK